MRKQSMPGRFSPSTRPGYEANVAAALREGAAMNSEKETCLNQEELNTTLEKAVDVAIEKLISTMEKTLETKTLSYHRPSGFSLVIWLGWVLTLSAVTAGILLPLDMPVVVGRLNAVTGGILLPLD